MNLTKIFLIFWTYVCIFGSFALYYPVPGEIYKALFWVVVSNIGFEMGGVFCNAYLPDIAPKNKIGRISGYGWSLGYLGGLIALCFALFLFVKTDVPIFGVDMLAAPDRTEIKFEKVSEIGLHVKPIQKSNGEIQYISSPKIKRIHCSITFTRNIMITFTTQHHSVTKRLEKKTNKKNQSYSAQINSTP